MPSLLDKLFGSQPGTRPARTVTAAADSFDALFGQGIQAAAAGEFRQAMQLFDRAIACDGTRAEAYYKRGNAQKDLELLDEAIESYNRAVELKPDFAYAYCNRGFVQQRLGR